MSQVQSKNPCLLVAMPQLQDPNFRRAVVLVIEHTTAGAIGFLINRRSPIHLRGILAQTDVEIPDDLPVWTGGPVMSSHGVILHGESPYPNDTVVAPGVCISPDKALVKKYVRHYGTGGAGSEELHPYRFLIGYAGWAPGQLDAEIRAGSWIQASIDREIIFGISDDQVWQACLKAVGIHNESAVTLGNNRYLN